MAKVTIKSFNIDHDYYIDERVEIYVDGARIGSGWYGGEPEDNTSFRTYSWVEVVIEALAEALGATVSCIYIDSEEEE